MSSIRETEMSNSGLVKPSFAPRISMWAKYLISCDDPSGFFYSSSKWGFQSKIVPGYPGPAGPMSRGKVTSLNALSAYRSYLESGFTETP